MSNRSAEIRAARDEDVFAIRATLMRALAAASVPLPEPDEPYFVQVMLDAIAQGLAWVASDPSGRVVGTLMLDHGRFPWVHPDAHAKHHLTNQHFWVEPRWRAGGTAARLIDAAKARAAAMGRVLWLEICYGESSAEIKDKFVESKGFRYAGGKFCVSPIVEPDGQEVLNLQ